MKYHIKHATWTHRKLLLQMHVVQEGKHFPPDRLLSRNNMYNRSVTAAVSKSSQIVTSVVVAAGRDILIRKSEV